MSDSDEKKSGSEGEEESYEVEKIISHKKSKGTILYEVKWKGYSLEETTWEPEENLTEGSEEILEEYKSTHLKDKGSAKKEKPSKTSGGRKARGSPVRDETPTFTPTKEKEEDKSDDDEFVPEKKMYFLLDTERCATGLKTKEPKAKRGRKSAATVSDSEDEDKPLAKVDYSTLPGVGDCEEVISVGRPKKTPADVPSEERFKVKFTKNRKLLIPSDDVQKYYPSQLAAFLLKRVQFREGTTMNGNGHSSPAPADDVDDHMSD